MKLSVIKNESKLLKNTNSDFRLLIGGNTGEVKKDTSEGTHSEYFYLAEGRLQEDEVKEMHVHDYGDEFIYVTKGKGIISSESEYHVVKKGRFLTSGGMGTMGYSIPAAMGAKLADKRRQVIAVCGDGSFQMSMMELATMRQHNIPVKIIVLKNNYLGMVREFQHYTYKDNYSVVDLSGSPDLEKLSSAYDMKFLRLENMDKAENILDEFLEKDESVLLECIINPMDLVK